MMKCKLLVIPALAGSLLLLGGCGYNKNNSLVVFNYGDYLDSSIIDSFERRLGSRSCMKSINPRKKCI